jgi:hypothetical protein
MEKISKIFCFAAVARATGVVVTKKKGGGVGGTAIAASIGGAGGRSREV